MEPVTSFFRKLYASLQGGEKQYIDYAVSFLFGMVLIVLDNTVLISYWLYDDPYLIRNAADHNLWEFFVSPQIWNKVSIGNLTPWVMVSYKMDLSLFGLSHRYFHAHQLLSLWLVAVCLYAVLKFWVPPFFAACSSLMFLVSAPVAAVAEILMTRHYIEGLLFALITFYFFVRALRNDSFFYSLLASGTYFLSVSAKEVFVPFAIVLLFLPEGPVRRKINRSLPLMGTVVLYFIWRTYMLGDPIAGPGDGLFSAYDDFGSVVVFFVNMYGTIMMFGGVSPIGRVTIPVMAAVFLMLASASIFLLIRKKDYSVFLFHLVLFAAVYAVPLSVINPYYAAADFAQYRLVFVISAYLAVMVSLTTHFLARKFSLLGLPDKERIVRYVSLLLPVGVAFVILASSAAWISIQNDSKVKPLVEEGKFFMEGDDSFLLVKTDPLWAGTFYFEHLEFLKYKYYNRSSPLVVYEYLAIPSVRSPLKIDRLSIVRYDSVRGGMSEISEQYKKERLAFFSRLKTLPLTAHISVDRGRFGYRVGPGKSGQYFFLFGYKPNIYCMKLELGQVRGTVSLATSLRVYSRIGWESPEGEITLSPEWFLDFSKVRNIEWSQ